MIYYFNTFKKVKNFTLFFKIIYSLFSLALFILYILLFINKLSSYSIIFIFKKKYLYI